MPSNNPEYQRKYIRQHYRKNKEYYFNKNKARKEKLLPKLRAYTDRVKTFYGCVDCGYKENPLALQFDHTRGTKFKEVSRMVFECYSKEKINEEIRKCDIRCANCHMIITQKRKTDALSS